MQSTNKPALYLTPFAQNDSSRAEIPNTTSDATRASQTLGFPPLTGLPPEAGGVPPQLPDMNGALNQISRIGWWGQVGGRFTFDPAFAGAAAINGYPRGAVLSSAALTGEWISTAEDNLANPDTAGTGWVPGYQYGATTLSGQSGGTITLTPAQAAKKVLLISGTLTSNLSIVVPAWVYDWTIYNNTAGAFTVSVRTAGQPAVNIPGTGSPTTIRCDGVTVAATTVEVVAASTTVAGVTRYSTTAEAAAGTLSNVAVTPAGLSAAVSATVPAASTTVTGRIRIGTPSEQAAGALADVAATPAGVKAVGDTKAPIVHTHAAADIVSGTLDLARVPALPVSRITTGVPTGSFARGASDGSFEFRSAAQTRTDIGAANLGGTNTFGGDQTVSGVVYAIGLVGLGFDCSVTANGGAVFIRPNGPGVTTGQATFNSNGSLVLSGELQPGGGVNTGSSSAVKTDVQDLPYGLDSVQALDVFSYRYTADFSADQRTRLGWIAEHVQEVIPEAVRPGDDACPLYLQVEQLVPVLWKAVQELAAEVQELRTRAGL